MLLAGTSSEGDGTARRFRGYFYGGVFSLRLVVGDGRLKVGVLFCLPSCFQAPARSAILIYSICYRVEIFERINRIVLILRKLLHYGTIDV